MSTYFNLRTPISRQELESIGVTFKDGTLEGHDKTWIVETEDTNYLHPEHDGDGMVYGFGRYGGNNPQYLLDILDNNGIDWCTEYDLDGCYPLEDIVDRLGLSIDEDDDSYDTLYDLVFDEWYAYDYYFASRDGRADEFIEEYIEEHGEHILSQL